MRKTKIVCTIGPASESIEKLIQLMEGGIVEEGGLTSHAAIVGVSMGIPVIVGVQNATSTLQDGQEVTVDAARGIVYDGYAIVL